MRKAQVALEFMMTYGWALFVVFAAIGTLFYLDLFNFDQFMVERCDISSDIYCVDGTFQNNQIQLVIQNAMVIDIENISVSIPGCADGIADGPEELISGEDALFNLTCSDLYEAYVKSNIYFNFTNPDSGLLHTKIGKILYKIPQ